MLTICASLMCPHGNTITIGNSPSFDIQVEKIPNTIKSIGRKVGDRYVHLFKSNIESILANGKNTLATQYTYNVAFDENAIKEKTLKSNVHQYPSFENFPAPSYDLMHEYAWDLENDIVYECAQVGYNVFSWMNTSYMQWKKWRDGNLYNYTYGVLKGVVTLDSQRASNYKVCFIEDIKDIDLSSTLYLQDMYRSLLLTGLSYRLAIRYKLNEWVNVFKEDFDDQKSLIKRVNNSNRPIVWNSFGDSYLDAYQDGLCGRGW